MTCGFYHDGKLIGLRSRADLATPEVQTIIAAAAQAGRHFLCGCCAERLRIFPVRMPARAGWTLRCAQYENTRHAVGCFALAESEIEGAGPTRPRVIYSASILLAPSPQAEGEWSAVGTSGIARTPAPAKQRYGNLTQLVQSLLEIATLRAFRVANPAPATYRDPDLRNPSTSEIFWELLGQLHEPAFTNGRSPLEAAAVANLRLVWGLTPIGIAADLAELNSDDDSVSFVVGGAWSEQGPVALPQEFRIARRTAAAAGGKVGAFGRLISPPFFYFMTVSADNEVSRLVLVPVAMTLDSFGCVESEPERGLVSLLLRSRLAFLKPNALADLGLLGPRLWPCPTSDERGFLPCRPDSLIFCRGVTVVQLLGSEDRAYLEGVELSLEKLRAHLPHPDVAFEKVAIAEAAEPAIARLLARLSRGARSGAGGPSCEWPGRD